MLACTYVVPRVAARARARSCGCIAAASSADESTRVHTLAVCFTHTAAISDPPR